MQHEKHNQHCGVIYKVKRVDSGHSHHKENFFFSFYLYLYEIKGFPCGTIVKNLPANAGDARDMGSIPESGRSPGVGNGNPLQYSCLENFMDRGAWWATVRLQRVRHDWATEHAHIWDNGNSVNLL